MAFPKPTTNLGNTFDFCKPFLLKIMKQYVNSLIDSTFATPLFPILTPFLIRPPLNGS